MNRRALIISDHCLPDHDGGAERIALYTAQAYGLRGFETRILCFNHTKDKQYEHAGVSIVSLYRKEYPFYWRTYRNLFSFASWKKMRASIREYNPAFVHVHNPHQYVTVAVLRFLARNYPTLLTLHDAMHISMAKTAPKDPSDPSSQWYRLSGLDNIRKYGLIYDPFYFYCLKQVLKRVHLIAVSQALSRLYRENGYHESRVIPNGLPQELPPGKSAVLETFGLRGREYLLHIGRLSGAKGTEQAVKAFDTLRKQRPTVLLVLAGARSDAERFRKHSAYPESILCTDWVGPDDAAALYQHAIAVLNLSLYLDPFPTTNIEALMYGCPVIGTCFGGTPEIIQDGVNGFIVNPYSVEAIVTAIQRLMDDPSLSERIRAAGVRAYTENYTLERYTERLDTVVRAITDPGSH